MWFGKYLNLIKDRNWPMWPRQDSIVRRRFLSHNKRSVSFSIGDSGIDHLFNHKMTPQ
jgi:hypothetical protein